MWISTNLKVRQRQVSHLTVEALKYYSSKASFIFLFENTEKNKLLRDFQSTFCQVFFTLYDSLITIHVISSGLSHFAISCLENDWF